MFVIFHTSFLSRPQAAGLGTEHHLLRPPQQLPQLGRGRRRRRQGGTEQEVPGQGMAVSKGLGSTVKVWGSWICWGFTQTHSANQLGGTIGCYS